jgi:P pilus assembly chaperone PapD
MRLIILSIFFVTSFSVSAGQLLIPDKAFLAPNQREAAFTYTNKTDQIIDVTAELSLWYPKGGGQAKSAEEGLQRDVLVYPPIARLGPQQTQIFRLIVRNRQLETPRYYRFNASWRPVRKDGQANTQMTLTTAFSMPVFFLEDGAQVNLQIGRLGNHKDQRVYRVHNTGNKPARIDGYRWHTQQELTTLGFYVWPGQERKIPFTAPPQAIRQPKLQLRVIGYGYAKER